MPETNEVKVENLNEFEFSKIKGFSYFNYCTKISKVVLEESGLTVNRNSKWFYFIKGKNKTAAVNYTSIDKVESKVHFSFWDLVFGLVFLLCLIISHEITWLIFAAVWLFCAFGKNIIIRLKNGSNVIIMSEGFGQQKEIDRFLGVINEKLQTFPTVDNAAESNELDQPVNELSDENIISKLPFKKMVENNQKIPPKIAPYINQIAAGIIIILLAGILYGIFGGTSISQLEEEVLASVQEQFSATDLKLVKVSKNVYSGMVYGTNIFGGEVQKTIIVVSYGRNFQWEFEN
jgi:uncharacterized membrane protein